MNGRPPEANDYETISLDTDPNSPATSTPASLSPLSFRFGYRRPAVSSPVSPAASDASLPLARRHSDLPPRKDSLPPEARPTPPRQHAEDEWESNSADDVEVADDVIFWNIPLAASPNPRRTKKDWLRALSSEAQDLTAALETYSDGVRKATREHMTRARSEPDSATLTRPSHLPRKPKHEEDKHLNEFRKMMARSQQLDRRRKALAQKAVDAHGKQQKADFAYWRDRVLPRLPVRITDPRVRDIVWRSGIPARDRERAWTLLVGNAREITHAQFKQFAGSARDRDGAVYDRIRRDADSTFVHTKLYNASDGPLREALVDTLVAYDNYGRPDSGYVTGMNLIAAALLLHLPPPAALSALANVVSYQPLATFYRTDTAKHAKFYSAFDKSLATHLPSLHHHFQAIDLHCSRYLDAFILPLFSLHLPLDFVPRLWDILFLEFLLDSPASAPRSAASASKSPLEALFIAVVLAFFKLDLPRLLVADSAGALAMLGWHAERASFGADPLVVELEFIKNVRACL